LATFAIEGTAATSGKAYVSPKVLRALGDIGKSSSNRQHVIVSFETARGRSTQVPKEVIASTRRTILSTLPSGSYTVRSEFARLPAVSLEVDARALDALRNHPNVYAINGDNVVEHQMIEANALTGVASVHAGGATGQGVRVAIIDTGVDSDHPRLVDDLFHQACFRTENDCVGGATSAEDQEGHGTHVAGMITGLNGVAPDAEFAALKVFTTGDTSDTNILNALDYIVDNDATLDIDLVNMSLGGDNFPDQATCDANSAAYVTAFAELNALGIAVFVATGNDAQIDEIGSPGCATGAVGVGSTGDATFSIAFSACTDNAAPDKVSCFSNATPVQGAGELVDLLAPGCDIASAGLNGTDGAGSCGTSMATPYAVGVAALVLEYVQDQAIAMTPALLEAHLEETGVPVTDYRITNSPNYPRVSPPNAIGALTIEAPANFAITGTTATTVSMGWNAVTGATEYRVYRIVGDEPATLAGSVLTDTTTFTDNAAPCGDLTYFVKSFDGSFESLPSNSDSDSARACPLTPTSLALQEVDADSITLSWNDEAADETGYLVEHRVNAAAFATLASLPAGAIAHAHDGIACGRNDYRVRAVRGADLSPPSNIVTYAACAPANDLFANAESLGSVSPATAVYTDTESNLRYGTRSDNDPIYACKFDGAGPGFHGLWYALTPSEPTQVTVTTAASTMSDGTNDVDTLVGIFTHDGSAFTARGCNDDLSGSNFRSTLTTQLLLPGTTYYVFVSNWYELPPTSGGDLVVGFTFAPAVIPPPHDEFPNARVVTLLPDNTYVDTVANAQRATTSASDPVHSCALVFGPRVGTHNLWYAFTPSDAGKLTLDTLPSSGSFTDTLVSIFTGTHGAFTEVACNDDEPAPGTSFRSKIIDVPLSEGTTYTIYTSRWNSTPTTTAGTQVLNLRFTADTVFNDGFE
jgi:subtilisin family serine protease